MNIFLLSSLVSILAVGLTWILTKRFASACLFFFFPWIGTLAMFEVFDGVEGYPSYHSPFAQELIGNAMIGAACGFILGAVVLAFMRPVARRDWRGFDLWTSLIDRWGIVISGVYSMVGIGYLVINLMRFGFSLNAIRMAHTGQLETGELIGYSESLVGYFIASGFGVLAMAIVAAVSGGRHAVVTTVLLLIAFAAHAMSMGGRIYMVVPLVFCVAVMSLIPGGVRWFAKKYNWRLVLAVVFVLYLFNAVLVLRGGYGEFKISDTFKGLGPEAVLSPFLYNTASVGALDCHTGAVVSNVSSSGYYTFDAFFRVAIKMGFLREYAYADFFELTSMQQSPVRAVAVAGWSQPGAIPKLVSDFGLLAMPFVLGVFCCLSQILGVRWSMSNSPVKFTMAAWVLLCCAYTMQSVHWFSIQTIITLLSILGWNYVVVGGSTFRGVVPAHGQPSTRV